jgi:hypothetical protein
MAKFFIYHFGYIAKLERIKPMEPKMGAYANHTHSKHPLHKLSQQNLHDSVKKE